MTRQRKKHIAWHAVVLLTFLWLFACRMPAQAASLDLSEIRQAFETAIQNKDTTVRFMSSSDYTLEQLKQQIAKAAENQGMLFTGVYTCQKQRAGTQIDYTVTLTEKSLVAVRRLKNTKAAYKAALIALQDCDYETKFYSGKSYYPIFLRILKQHPEYNYDTMAWKHSDGTYGYRRSSELTGSEQNKKMRAAEKKAEAFVSSRLSGGMTTLQKFRAIHDYVLGTCSYDYDLGKIRGYEDSLTAYGALVKKKAICQGYTAAFNLVAQKAGLYSMAVCGSAVNGSHTWNYVKIGKKYRYVDCTWDDTLQWSGPGICRAYFAVKKAMIAQNHYWNKSRYTSKHLKYCRYLL